jgi:flagellar hook assembly protein FlgD
VIRYSISARGRVRLKIYDVSGRLVRTLVDRVQDPVATGYEVTWDGTRNAGGRAGSGVYFYELDSPGFAATRKLVLIE